MISDKKFYTRVLTKDDLNLVSDLEEIAFKAQKDPWGTQAIQESFEDSYVLLGLFHYQKVIGLIGCAGAGFAYPRALEEIKEIKENN